MKTGPGLQHGLAQSAQSGYFIVQLPGTSCACVQSALRAIRLHPPQLPQQPQQPPVPKLRCSGCSGAGL